MNRVVTAAAAFCDAPSDCEVSISVISADEIQQLNHEYRGKDEATDVLSFPVSEGLAMCDVVSLGDIAICMDIAKAQAEEYGHSLERELAFLVVHGMLHLLGYDHEIAEDETEMLGTQEQILSGLNVTRD